VTNLTLLDVLEQLGVSGDVLEALIPASDVLADYQPDRDTVYAIAWTIWVITQLDAISPYAEDLWEWWNRMPEWVRALWWIILAAVKAILEVELETPR
jgi:hypothetical protein